MSIQSVQEDLCPDKPVSVSAFDPLFLTPRLAEATLVISHALPPSSVFLEEWPRAGRTSLSKPPIPRGFVHIISATFLLISHLNRHMQTHCCCTPYLKYSRSKSGIPWWHQRRADLCPGYRSNLLSLFPLSTVTRFFISRLLHSAGCDHGFGRRLHLHRARHG